MSPDEPILRSSRRALCVVSLALLAGCVSLPTEQAASLPPAPTVNPPNLTPLRQVMRFGLAGRFAARHQGQQLSGQFSHQTDGANTITEVYSPLGTVLARLQVDAQGTTLALADGTIRNEASVAGLVRQFTGLTVQDEWLPYWLRGLPREEKPGSSEQFTEAGWQIEVLARHPAPLSPPQRMRWLALDTPGSEILWLIDRWSFD